MINSSILVAFVCLFNTYSVPGYAIMRIGRLAGIIGLNLCFSPTPRVGRASNSINPCKLVGECFVVVYMVVLFYDGNPSDAS